MIYVRAAREAYNEGIVDDIIWIRLTYNLSNSMTKSIILLQLFEMMETGNIYCEVEPSINKTIG